MKTLDEAKQELLREFQARSEFQERKTEHGTEVKYTLPLDLVIVRAMPDGKTRFELIGTEEYQRHLVGREVMRGKLLELRAAALAAEAENDAKEFGAAWEEIPGLRGEVIGIERCIEALFPGDLAEPAREVME